MSDALKELIKDGENEEFGPSLTHQYQRHEIKDMQLSMNLQVNELES